MIKVRRFQFRLRTLLLFVVAASLALAAMRYATPAWASAIVTATVLTSLISLSLAATSRGEQRSFWIGFAVCGIGYLVVATTSLAPELVEGLATSKAVAFLFERFHSPPQYPTPSVVTPTYGTSVTTAYGAPSPAPAGVYYAPSTTTAYPYATPYVGTPSAPAPLLPSQQKGRNDYYYAGPQSETYEVTRMNFLLIGQCIWALVLATLGGMLVRLVAGRGTEEARGL